MIGNADRWLSDVLLGRPVRTHVLARIVHLYPKEADDDLLAVAASLPAGDSRMRMFAALAIRDPFKPDIELMHHALDVSREASDQARSDVYLTLAPWADPNTFSALTKLTFDLPDALGEHTRNTIERFRVTEFEKGITTKPGSLLDAIDEASPLIVEAIDAELALQLENLDPGEQQDVLKEALDRALFAITSTTGAEPPGAEAPVLVDDAVAAPSAPRASEPSALPPPAPPPPSRPERTFGSPTLSLPSILDRIRDGLGRLGGFKITFPQSGAPEAGDTGGDESTEARRPQKVVNTGLARMDRPGEPLDRDVGLAVGGDHVFWLEIGEPVKGSIETSLAGIAKELAQQRATLTVLLFDADGSRIVRPGMERAELKMSPDGSATVRKQPSDLLDPTTDKKLFGRRLFFPLRPQADLGTASFRCNIYFEGVLIQSRLIRCEVLPAGQRRPDALRSTLDYVLTRSLTPASLRETEPHELSIMVNEGDRGTHGFYFASGKSTWAKGADFDGGEIQALLGEARGALRLAAWGTKEPWNHEPYRYAGDPDRARMTQDLFRICIRGFSFYSALIDRMAGTDADGESRADKLTGMMRAPGTVQVALHASPRLVLPAALIYDYDLDTGLSLSKYRLCEQFLQDLGDGKPLRTADCFNGKCPNASGNFTVICPSGLWGYRHSIGLPVSLKGGEETPGAAAPDAEPGDSSDPPGKIDVKGPLAFSVGISTDPDLVMWKAHQTRMQALRADLGWTVADTRDKTIELMQAATGHVVYFYCHGGQTNGRPFIHVGPNDDEAIFSDNLRVRKIRWKDPRPLVFINGCHTVAVEPELAHELVSGFVTIARAAGVIGTEITIFEPLAGAFGVAFMQSFIAGDSVGDAVRTARLALLEQSNPLGLAYTAYALANLKLATVH